LVTGAEVALTKNVLLNFRLIIAEQFTDFHKETTLTPIDFDLKRILNSCQGDKIY